MPVAEVIRKHGVSRATYSRRQAKHANATVSELTRPRELAHEKARLEREYAVFVGDSATEPALVVAALKRGVSPARSA